MNFEIAVGQVWRECAEDCEGMWDDVEIVAVTDSEVCVKYTDGGFFVFNHSDFHSEHKPIKHESGADVDKDVYEYRKFGNHENSKGWEQYCNVGHWASSGGLACPKSLYRREKHAEPELPYVDCEVYEHGNNLCFTSPKSYKKTLSRAVDNKRFVGYVYGDECTYPSPRVPSGDNTPALIPTHVRFAR